jgi:hypothetical protein
MAPSLILYHSIALPIWGRWHAAGYFNEARRISHAGAVWRLLARRDDCGNLARASSSGVAALQTRCRSRELGET